MRNRQLLTDLGNLPEVLFSGLLIHRLGKFRVTSDEMAGAFHHQYDAPVEILLLALGGSQMLQRLLPNPLRAKGQPLLGIGADMTLGVILLVNLDHLGNGIHLGAYGLTDLVFQRTALPIGQNLVAEFLHILLPNLEAVLRTGRKGFKLLGDPGSAGLREYHAAPDTGGTVAHDSLFRFNPDGNLFQRSFQGHRALDAARLILRLLVALGDDASLLNGGKPGLVQHIPLECCNSFRLGQSADVFNRIHK